MTVLPELLREIADGVVAYDVGGRVLVRARRRRRLHRAASGLAATVVLLVVVGLVAGPYRHRVPVASALSWLPARVPAPYGLLPLQANEAVGPGSLVYSQCVTGCAPILVLPDGTQFTIPTTPPSGDAMTSGVALSPDGRWLVYRDDQGRAVIRDLTSTAATAWPASRPRAWSPDGRWLVLVQQQPSGTPVAVVIQLPSGGYRLADAVNAAGYGLVAILDSGQLVYAGRPAGAGTQRVHVLDVDDRLVKQDFTMPASDSPAATRPYPRLFPENPTGGTFLAQGVDGAVFRVDGVRGALLHTYPAPSPSPRVGWQFSALVGKTVIMIRAPAAQPEVAALDPATGALSTVCVVDRGYGQLVVRGSVE